MISQNLWTLSKMISNQWLLIFKRVSHHLSLSITALASLKPQAAPGIIPGAAMPAALSKMISIQWLLIFKKVPHHLSLSITALASLKPQAAPGIVPGVAMPAALSKMISENLQLCKRWFQFNLFWYLRKFPIIVLSWSVLGLLKPQAAPDIVPGAAMAAALSKMISQNLRALLKIISIQWLLIFKKVSHHLSLSITALASLKPQTTPGILPGAVMPAALSKMISQSYKHCQRWFQFNDFWYLRKFPMIFLSWSALASLKPQDALGIVPGAAMPAALSKMISQKLRTLSKMISIQWLLIFKTVFHHLFLLISLGLAEAPCCTRHRTRGSHASCFVKDDFNSRTPDI